MTDATADQQSIPGHGSPAGEPTPDQVAQWRTAEEGRTATKAATQTIAPGARPTAANEPAPAGPGSRDTPPPGEQAAAAAGTPPSVTRPPRPTAAKQQEAPAKQHEPPATAQQAKLVDAITRRLADNLAKALRQSVVEAVQELDSPGAGAQAASPPPEPAVAAPRSAAPLRPGHPL